jgi:hypothetical protein
LDVTNVQVLINKLAKCLELGGGEEVNGTNSEALLKVDFDVVRSVRC